MHGGTSVHGAILLQRNAVPSLTVFDTPVGYHPPRGPAIGFKVTYDQFDVSDFTEPYNVANMAPNVNFDYFSYVNYDSTSSNVNLFVRGGVIDTYTGYDTNSSNYAVQVGLHTRHSASKQPHNFPSDASRWIERDV